MSDKKRREPEIVPPVEYAGIRYEVPLDGANYGYSQCGGIVIARDVTTNHLVWTHRIYSCNFDLGIEEDKMDIFISSLALIENNTALAIENEHGKHFKVMVKDAVVKQLPEK